MKLKRIIFIILIFLGMSNVVSGVTYQTTKNVKEIEITFPKGVQSRLYGVKKDYDLRDYINLKVNVLNLYQIFLQVYLIFLQLYL